MAGGTLIEFTAARAPSLLGSLVLFILLAGFLLVTGGPQGTPAEPTLAQKAVVRPSINGSGAVLSVDPPSFSMRSGTNLTLQAIWSAKTPVCRVIPLWYRWSEVDGNATGFLNSTTGPSTTFAAESFDSGTATVVIHSDAGLDCQGSETIIDRQREANISIGAPLSVFSVELGPNPILPGQFATLQGVVVGGESPYQVEIGWGDGTHSLFTLPRPGSFSDSHKFPAGNFLPSVFLGDSGGDLLNVSVDEALSVGTGLEVAILSTSYNAEVGIPVEFTGVVDDNSPGTITLFDCSNATKDSSTVTPGTSNDTSFSCTFTSPGTAIVAFGAYPPQAGGPSASVVLYETIVAAPSVSIQLVEPIEEAGGQVQARVDVSGGVLPISLFWNISGNRSGGEELLSADGEGTISLALGSPGYLTISSRVIDALGTEATNDTSTLRVVSLLGANVSATSTLISNEAIVQIRGILFPGCPPFSWWVVPELSATNSSTGNGNLEDGGTFAWTGRYATEGNLSIRVGAVDGCGVSWQTNLWVVLIPALSFNATVSPGPVGSNETIAVNLSIQNGLPPFQVSLNASDNESWNRVLSSDGEYRWLLPTHWNGSLAVSVVVSDGLGVVVSTNRSVVLVAPRASTVSQPLPPPPPPSVVPGSPSVLAVPSSVDPFWLLMPILLWAGIAVSLALFRRRFARGKRRIEPPFRNPQRDPGSVPPERRRMFCPSKARFIGAREPDRERGRGGNSRRPDAPPDELEPEDDCRGRRRSADR